MTNLMGSNLNNGVDVGPQGEGRESPSTFPSYPEYKDSGVEWLGLIPKKWTVIAPKRVIRHESGGTEIKGNCALEPSDGLYPAFSASGQDVWLPSYRYDLSGLVLSAVGARCGKTFKADGRWGVVANTQCLIPSSEASRDYFWYLTNIGNWWEIGGSAQPFVLTSTTLDRLFALPPLAEQTQIARFLDRETARIDALIEEQQRLIELLKEKRQAVISHAVTKGLDPTVPMKDSGVEWLGEVPAHWPLPKLGHLARVLNGSTPSRENMDYWHEGDIPWIASGSLNDYRIDLASEFITKKALKECSVEMIPRGAILVGLVGQGKTRGLAALLNIEATINQNVCAVVPDKEKVLSGHLHLYLHCIYEPLRDFGRGANQAALNCELVSALRIPLPCIEEQSRIVRYIENKLNEFDALEDYAQRSIGFMQERRSALISAAVTGKIDVRGWQPPAIAQAPELVQEAV